MRNRKCISHAFIQSSAACLSVIILILLFALPVSASYYPNDPVGWKDGDTLGSVIYAILDSWGISISKSSSDPVSITEYAQGLLNDYIEDSNQIADDIWQGIQLGVNKLGQLIGNNYLVDFVRGFANWLIGRYDLDDYITVTPGLVSDAFITLSGDQYPIMPKEAIYNSDGTWLSNAILRQNVLPYVIPPGIYSFSEYGVLNINTYSKVIISYPNTRGFTWSPSLGNGSFLVAAEFFDGSYGFLNVKNGTGSPYHLTYTGAASDTTNSANAVYYLFNDVDPDNVPTLTIDTREIDIPTSTPSDGIIIDVPGTNWGDSLFDILDLIERLIILYDGTQLEVISIIDTLSNLLSTLNTPISVENIPGGVVLNYDGYDLPLDLDWEFVNDFFGDINITKGFSAISDLVYYYRPFRLFVIVIGLTIIAYGFIRMGRDSH